MPTYVVLLRAVNVGGQTLRMSELRTMLAKRGWRRSQTLRQTGNILLVDDRRDAGELEGLLSNEIERYFGLVTEVFVRSLPEWSRIVSENPYPSEASSDPSHLVVTLLKGRVEASNWETLRAAIRGSERFVARGHHAYIVYPDGIGRSKLTPALLERSLGTRGTSRNWNTVLALEKAARDLDHP